ncbi:MAG TPA: TonB-dependent receptor [Terricaulis sp.]|nr:TonB-dependent receptor [Terricaulis sp.]
MHQGTKARWLVGASTILLAALSAGPAFAQSNEDAAAQENEIIVTAQRRAERIQDVPIAITALNEEALTAQRIEGGPDLLRAIPNVTFSRGNFTSNNFAIRGVGTKAVSATTDPGVAVSFNQVGIIQNRLFEQEYYDMERVEVLRGPQGTLYGRNATGGVINIVPRSVNFDAFEGNLEAEVGNYDTRRISAMVNIPLIDDRLAVRFAGALTQRSGYDYNSVTENNINGRDLWSGRLTIGFEPTSNFRGSFVWEHFDEDDNRSRTGKQLCNRDEPPETIGSITVTDPVGPFPQTPFDLLARPALFSTGCEAGSLYDDEAFGTPNGLSIPFVLSFLATGNWGYYGDPSDPFSLESVGLLQVVDPYGGQMQSRDLREIASFRDPVYRAQADIFQLNLEYDIGANFTFNSQTLYVEDSVYSFQDLNRFNTVPIFNDTTQFVEHWGYGVSPYQNAAPGGVFCDPQLGCSNTMAAFDISRADATQFTQEFRLSSSFNGPFNFSIGANYTEFETLTQYYVMNNVLTALAMSFPFNQSGSMDLCSMADWTGSTPGNVPMESDHFCPYIDPNPVESINGEGHNYFRSVNPYELRSAAAFAELYWEARENLRVTAGARYTRDQKNFTIVPTQLLLTPTLTGGGMVNRGYPVTDELELEWGEWTGRLGFDWRPDLGLTDETLIYAFISRGYKAGGMNPPLPGFSTGEEWVEAGLIDQATYDLYEAWGVLPILRTIGLEYGQTFDPEFVNAFEIGIKNTLFDGAMRFNATGFYYDYTDYQVSQIRNRAAINENFDAEVWGAEFELLWEPIEGLRINSNLGYLQTRIADGEGSIDIINRTLGSSDYTLVRAWAQVPSNCVVPTGVAEDYLANNGGIGNYFVVCDGYGGIGAIFGTPPTDPATGLAYDVANYPELNNGSGLTTDLSGNELPNSPRFTFNFGAEYTLPLIDNWTVTLRGDYYWQDDSYHRVYNYEPYDRLQGWDYVNIGLWFDRGDNLRFEFYVRNVFDETPITDAFLNSDDQGLTTNIFTLDPRIIGASVRATF